MNFHATGKFVLQNFSRLNMLGISLANSQEMASTPFQEKLCWYQSLICWIALLTMRAPRAFERLRFGLSSAKLKWCLHAKILTGPLAHSAGVFGAENVIRPR